jgi:TrmH family RNA methyltransferase
MEPVAASMTLISSRQNDRVKAIRALRDKKERDASGAFFAEGERLLRAGLQTGAAFELVVLAPERLTKSEAALVEALEELEVPLLEVTPDLFDALSFREEAQSVGAVITQRWETLSSVSETRRCWLALHEIQHPGNLGTLIRNCDAIGGDGVILTGRSTDPYHPVAVRGSLGALFSQRIVKSTPEELAAWLPHSGCTVVGTALDGAKDYREVDYATKPVVIMGGNERAGISKEQSALCDELVRIPMAGYVESLNLSVATALVLYEVLRQREQLAGNREPGTGTDGQV